MTQFLLNGTRQDLPAATADEVIQFGKLIENVMMQAQSFGQAVSEIKVNGIVLGDDDTQALAEMDINEMLSIEISSKPYRALAAETLETLKLFVDQIISLSVACRNGDDLRKLVDGVNILVESLEQCRGAIEVGKNQILDELEADLLGILTRLVDLTNQAELATAPALLQESLPRHLKRWKEKGIPTLISAARAEASTPNSI